MLKLSTIIIIIIIKSFQQRQEKQNVINTKAPMGVENQVRKG